MRNRLAGLAILVLSLGALCSPALAAAKAKSSANKSGTAATTSAEAGTWKVQVSPDSDAAAKGEKEFEDTLVLNKGKFKSTACVPYGFGTVPYKVEAGTWMADMESQKEGKTHWHGEVSGDSISGKMIWTKADGTVLNYAFNGTRAGGQGAQSQKSH
jgi:hypothetical protein